MLRVPCAQRAEQRSLCLMLLHIPSLNPFQKPNNGRAPTHPPALSRRNHFINRRGQMGGAPPPTPLTPLSHAKLCASKNALPSTTSLQNPRESFLNPSCEHCVCTWGSLPCCLRQCRLAAKNIAPSGVSRCRMCLETAG